MSAYENMVSFYGSLHEIFGWSVDDVDSTDLNYLLDLVVVRAREYDFKKRKDDIAEADKIL